ncbi:MAG: hypothetical protein CL758_03780 [Chloroflexi bacterium]|nr:hypothetical protein [Chloroflexota bacterium]|tara:strand:- start:129 stop:866 length:738 start_codon:yes stop_codon:yes gene_type:complete
MKSPIKIWLEWYETLRTGFSSSAQLPTQDSSSINAEIDNPERLWDLSDLDATLADTVSEPSASEIQTNIADTKNSPLDLEEDVNSDSDPDISDLIDISEDDSADEIQVNTKPVNKPKVQYASLNADSDALENSTDEEANDNEEELVGVSQVKAVNLEASSETEDSLPEEGAKDESDLDDIFSSSDSEEEEKDLFADDSDSGFSDVFSEEIVTKPHIKMLLEKHGTYTAEEILNEIKEFTWNREVK